MTAGEPEIRQALRQDEGLELLAEMMEVSERFHFFILVCDTPRVARTALDLLRERVEAARGGPVRVTVIDPYESPDIRLQTPLDPAFLLAFVLPSLQRVEPDDIRVLDASRAIRQDDRAWNLLFQRMNEQRNTIVHANTGSLILCLPHALEVVFARAAPDFWSIRSTAVSLAALPAVAPRSQRAFLQEVLRSTLVTTVEIMSTQMRGDDGTGRAYDPAVDVSERVHTLLFLTVQALVGGRPNDALRAAGDCVALMNSMSDPDPGLQCDSLRWLAWACTFRGETDRAATTIGTCVDIMRRETLYRRSDATPLLANFLLDQAQIDLWSGLYARADRAAHEAVALAERVLAEQPDSVDVRGWLAMFLDCRGDVAYESGAVERAANDYASAVQHRRELLDRWPDVVTFVLGAAESMLRCGIATWTLQGPEPALLICDEAIHMLRRVVEVSASSDEASHILAMHLGNLGNLHHERGDLPRADLAYQEALEICRRLLSIDPRNILWRHTSAASLMRRARFAEQERRGELEDAIVALREARQLLGGMLEELPARTDWSEMLVECDTALVRMTRLKVAE